MINDCNLVARHCENRATVDLSKKIFRGQWSALTDGSVRQQNKLRVVVVFVINTSGGAA